MLRRRYHPNSKILIQNNFEDRFKIDEDVSNELKEYQIACKSFLLSFRRQCAVCFKRPATRLLEAAPRTSQQQCSLSGHVAKMPFRNRFAIAVKMHRKRS